MASGFPASIDNFTDPLSNSPLNSPSHSAQHADLNDAVEKIEEFAVPFGTIFPFAGSTAPTGWLLSFGQAVSRTTYSKLFTAISTTYGSGDGSTTFNLPDLRGRVIAGLDNMGGTAASRLTSTVLTASNTLGATGGTQTNTHNHYQSIGNDGSVTYIGTFSNQPRSKVVTVNRATQFNTPASGVGRFDSTDNETIDVTQPTIVLNYIIRAG